MFRAWLLDRFCVQNVIAYVRSVNCVIYGHSVDRRRLQLAARKQNVDVEHRVVHLSHFEKNDQP